MALNFVLLIFSLAQEGSGPEVSGLTELTVTDNVANALIGFDVNSLAATVNDGKLLT